LNGAMTISHSIVAGNTAGGGNPDIDPGGGIFDVNFSLLGTAVTPDAGGIGNQFEDSPLLGPLADNGGPTLTHALLAGSLAIDAGDPAAVAGAGNTPLFDQRGTGFDRVRAGRIDIGAFEVQTVTCDFDADGDCDLDDIDALVMEIVAGTNSASFDLTGDGSVNLADRDQWLADAGALNLVSGNPYLLGDANLDGNVDGQDFLIWNSNKFSSTGRWSQGDFNADGNTDGQDFLIWNSNKFQSSDTVSSRDSGSTNRLREMAFSSLFEEDREEDKRNRLSTGAAEGSLVDAVFGAFVGLGLPL